MTRPFFQGVFEDCLLGRTDLKIVLPPFLQQWQWPGSVDQFVNTWLEVENAVDGRMVQVIQDLRRSGLLCCLGTSQEQYRADYMRSTMGFAGLFDHLFFSCELGCQKPDSAFFQVVAQTLGLSGGQILFWDDSLANVQGARECGWNAEAYTDFESFQTKLDQYLS